MQTISTPLYDKKMHCICLQLDEIKLIHIRLHIYANLDKIKTRGYTELLYYDEYNYLIRYIDPKIKVRVLNDLGVDLESSILKETI
ncbi:MAG: hypothetical protein ACMUEM_04805 [Flavobacteriales bacterium AspAUS03]